MCDVCNLRELYAMSFFQVSCTVTMASYSDLKGSSTVGVKRFRYAEMLFQPSYQPVGVATHLSRSDIKCNVLLPQQIARRMKCCQARTYSSRLLSA